MCAAVSVCHDITSARAHAKMRGGGVYLKTKRVPNTLWAVAPLKRLDDCDVGASSIYSVRDWWAL